MSYCINTSHPDFIKLQRESGLKSEILQAKIGVWMTDNTADRFPTLDELALKNVLYQKPTLNPYQKAAKDLFFNTVWNKSLTPYEIERVNEQLKKISDRIGDTTWHLRQSEKGNWYVAGYKNRPVTVEGYYSPYANGMFRQMESRDSREANQILDQKLFAWAKKHGISIEAMDTLIERFENRYADGVMGVADFANALIGIADGRGIDTLPEEVAHFAIEILKDHSSIKRAMEEVTKSPEYAIVKEEYKDIYTTEEEFKKETLGKLLAKEIVDQFTKDETTDKSSSVWTYIKGAAKKFINWVQSKFAKGTDARTDLDNILAPLATAILEGQYLGEFEANIPRTVEALYQTAPKPEPQKTEDISLKKKAEFVQEAIYKLAARVNKMQNTAAASSVANLLLNKEIEMLKMQLAKGELDLAISGFIKLAEMEVNQVEQSLMLLREKQNPETSRILYAKNLVDMYDDLFCEFRKSMSDSQIPFEETEELRKEISNLALKINTSQGIIDALQKQSSERVLEQANTRADGSKIDPNFDSKEISETTHTDIGYWRLWVGNYKYADSGILRTAFKIVFDAIQNVRRFTVQTGNKILKAQQDALASGGNIMDLIETDEKGNPTQFFIREYHWGKYYEAMGQLKQQIAEKLGYDDYSKIQIPFLTPEEIETYKSMWKKWHKSHSSATYITDTEGKRIKKTVPNESYRNRKFDEVMANPAMKTYYETLITAKREAIKKLPARYQNERFVYMLPGILKSNLERLTNTNESFLTRIGKLGREALFIDNDDTQFGQLNVFNNKMVPIHFLSQFENTNDLSFDVARTVTLFAEMAENFHQMNKIAPDLTVVQNTLAERNYINKKGIREKGIQKREYQALQTLIDTAVFGMEKPSASIAVPSNRVTEAMGIAGKQFSGSKFSQALATFIRDNNLAFNITTSLSGWLKGSGDSIIEDIVGTYTNTESKNWSRTEFAKNLTDVIGEIGKAKQTNKMHLILQENEIVDLNRMLFETQRGRVARKLLTKDVMYTTFATGDYGVKGRITLAIYDNHRLYNGKFMTRAQFVDFRMAEGVTEKEARKEWSDLREQSLYNAYEVVDGQLIVKKEFEKFVTPELLNNIKGKVEHVTTYVDGTMSRTDKGALSRTMAGDFLLMHRGWFIGLVDTRFRKASVNPITEEEEMGTYRATASFVYEAFYQNLIKDKVGLKAAFATWHTLSPAKKRGVLKTALDLLFLQVVALIAAIANAMADDDEDNMALQYTAYQLNRLLLEQGAAWSPAELIQMIDEPVVGARMIRDLVDLKEAFNFGEVYESGMYEDKSHAAKWWMKKLPTRNIYELQFPEMKNRFVKTMLDSRYYDWMTDDEKHKVAKRGGGFVNWLFPSWDSMTTDYSPEVERIVTEEDDSEDLI